MLIDEKGLVKAIKRAYKADGYNVMNLGNQVAIYTDGWYLRCDWGKFPRKALATIVEHLGMVPPSSDALTVVAKEEPQVIMPEIVGQEVACWVNGNTDERVTMVPVTFKGLSLYQLDEGGKCYGVDPISLGIVERTVAEYKDGMVMSESRMGWQHDGEMVVVSTSRPTAAYWAKEWEQKAWAALESVDLHRREE